MIGSINSKVLHLRQILDQHDQCLIAYSGGVDSAFLLWFATHHSSTQARGVLADSESLKRSELAAAVQFCEKHELELDIIQTEELQNPDYVSNPLNRCYYCKHTLFEQMDQLAQQQGVSALCYGENADDAKHDRPGRQAAHQFQIMAPLQLANLSKQEIRSVAASFHLGVSDKKAQPCLASRIEHGIPVTSDKLRLVEEAENFMDSIGFQIVRVRHRGDNAKVQVAPDETPRLLDPAISDQVTAKLKSLGFKQVILDHNGYQGAGLL